MKRVHRIPRLLIVCALTALALPLAARPASAVDFGVRAGGYLEDNDPFIGLELLSSMGSSDWYFNPNVEFVFADERDRVALNFDFHYDFQRTADYYVWAGGGLAGIHTDGNRGRGSDTEAGVNLLGGVGWRLDNLTPYAQVKVVLADDSELVAAVGIRF